MSKHIRFLAVLALLPAFGLGCLRLGPRVVKGPDAPQKQLVKTEKQEPQKDLTFEDQYESASSSDAVAYLILNGGEAKLKRSGVEVEAVDGTELASGDQIKVQSGEVYIIYPDSGESRLETGADVSLVMEEGQGGIFMDLELAAGRVWTRFERLLGAEEQYSVVANGVVATVRGTAFGVAVDEDGVDVQVADHAVEVATEDPASGMTEPVKIVSGEGLKIVTKGIALKELRALKTAVRKLDQTEIGAAGFKFGTLKIPAERLKRPEKIWKLKVPASLPPRLIELRKQMIQRPAILKSGSFMVPLRAPTIEETAPTNSAPSILGPRG